MAPLEHSAEKLDESMKEKTGRFDDDRTLITLVYN
jgi:hypothetical protein